MMRNKRVKYDHGEAWHGMVWHHVVQGVLWWDLAWQRILVREKGGGCGGMFAAFVAVSGGGSSCVCVFGGVLTGAFSGAAVGGLHVDVDGSGGGEGGGSRMKGKEE